MEAYELGDWFTKAQRGPRGIWSNGEHTHVEVLAIDEARRAGYAEALRREAESLSGVAWARLNGVLARLVVAHTHSGLDEASLVARVEAVEVAFEAGPEFARAAPAYPGDHAPVRRNGLEMAADGASLLVNLTRHLAGEERAPFDLDLAAIVTLLDGIPRVKRALARVASRNFADLTVELSKTSAQLATMSEAGPVVTALRHGLRLLEARARENVWGERAAELCGDPQVQPIAPPRPRPRPAPLRKGLVDRYDDVAVPVALGAFGTSLWFTKSVEASSSALFAGLPRAAHQGQSAFAAWLGWLLARRGVLVIDGEALRRLEYLDAVVVDGASLAPADVERVVAHATSLELRSLVQDRTGRLAGAENGKLAKSIRQLQRDGSGVALVARGPCKAYGQADLAIALAGEAPPWGAHVLTKNGIEDVVWLLDAIAAAKHAARELVALAGIEATTGAVLSFAGLERETARRTLNLSNLASLLALLDGARLAHALDREPSPPRPPTPPHHAMGGDEVLASTKSNAAGLSSREAAERLPPRPPRRSRLRRFATAMWEEVKNPMTPVLALGAGVSASVGSGVDAGLILGAVGLNGVIGGSQRHRAERAIGDLERREEPSTRVVRDGTTCAVTPSEIVVGDVVELEAGELVPADCRILEASGLEADEASLTGESLPVAKSAEPSASDVVAERSSMLYAGTSIAAGSARAVVVAVDSDTEAGRARAAASTSTEAGGVERRLQSLASLTIPVAGVSALALLGSGLARGHAFEDVIGSSVGLGAAAVPEGLPLLATLAQLSAARRLSTKGILVRNPRSLEPLGRVDVFCADKTGTLTEGNIRLSVVSDGKKVTRVTDAKRAARSILELALQATPKPNGTPLPHPTDEALVRGLEAIGLHAEIDRMIELPFEPARGYHATLGMRDGERILAVKGAPEVVLSRCTKLRRKNKNGRLSRSAAEALAKKARSLAAEGYRVLAVAEGCPRANGAFEDEHVRDLAFCGFVGLADAVRDRSRAALRQLSAAGVRTIMITGDHPSTALAIAKELGLGDGDVVTGTDLEALDDTSLGARLNEVSVVARVTPAQKVRLVRVLRARGHTVAMTGDGANDAAAIELADVGIALGENSTAAARNAADLVVTDGRIETIVEAVLEGRSLWASVRDAVAILVGGNLGEIAFTLASGLVTGKSPLNARQLLLVNLVTDTLPALALAVQPPKPDQLTRLADEGPEASLGDQLDAAMIRRAAVTAGAAGTAQLWARLSGCSPEKASTVSLLALTGAQLGQTLVAGGKNRYVLGASLASIATLLAVVELPGISHFFGCRPLGPIALFEATATCAAATAVAAALDRRAARPRPEPDPPDVQKAPEAAPSEREQLARAEKPEAPARQVAVAQAAVESVESPPRKKSERKKSKRKKARREPHVAA